MKIILKTVIASGLLNLISLAEVNKAVSSKVNTKGFPFGFVEENASQAQSINPASLAANWIFWAVVVIVAFFVLRWAWDKFSRMVFYILVAAGVATYFGSISVF